MNWEAIGSAAELVAALATVATLVYLAIQIRQNTISVRAATHHAGATAFRDLVAWLAGDAELAELYYRGRTDPASLSKSELRRFELVMDAWLAMLENYYIQFLEGMLPATNQDRFALVLKMQFRLPGVRQYWQRRRGAWRVEFVSYLEQELGVLRDAPEPPPAGAAQ